MDANMKYMVLREYTTTDAMVASPVFGTRAAAEAEAERQAEAMPHTEVILVAILGRVKSEPKLVTTWKEVS